MEHLPPQIERIYLRWLPHMTDAIFDKLPQFAQLSSLDLSQSRLSFDHLNQLAVLNLQDLFLWQSLALEDKHLAWLSGKHMKRLDISHCKQLTDDCLSFLKGIETIYIDKDNYMSEEAVKLLYESPDVKTVSFYSGPSKMPIQEPKAKL